MTVLPEQSGRQNSAYRSGCHISFSFNNLLTSLDRSGHNSVHFANRDAPVARVNITKQVKTQHGWRNVALARDARRRIKWTVGSGRYIIEWRENGRRQRAAAGVTPAEALEAQKRKRLELGARETGLELSGVSDEEKKLPLQRPSKRSSKT